jgi:glutamine synthetase
MTIGVDTLPVLPTDPGDRNRTSPFAFTGNRFEFRAPGSMQTVSGPMVTINTIMAESLDHIATVLEADVAAGIDFDEAVQKLLTQIITDHGAIVFNGDGYADAWPIEAEKRGLANLKTTLDALPELITPAALELFEKYKVFNHREMHSRYEIGLEQYANTIAVEAKLTLEIGTTVVLPAAVRHQTEVATNIAALKAAGVEVDLAPLEAVSAPIAELRTALAGLRIALTTDAGHEAQAEAEYARSALLPAMSGVRAAADALEDIVADDLWPLPTYQEMLFVL